ncbi:MAG: alpha/beta fold hydrolase [Chitinophagaceae bacterium]|nr:alpha/beta fold hydrolase [Chitinophagaceae bacterium]
MVSATISYQSSYIHYKKVGYGQTFIFCFHGYGEEAVAFEFLGKHAGNQFTFFAIDLPFHGKTDWKDGINFTANDLQQILYGILEQNNSKPPTSNFQPQNPNPKLSLLGFSLGGRMALSLYQTIPEKIEKLVLLAPDGLKVNFWYWLATQTWLGNKFFKLTMKKPGWFLGFLKLLNKLKLVNTSIFKFVTYYIGDAEVRRLLYARWTTLRKIKPNISLIKKNIRKHKTPVRLVYGKHDRIILSSVGEKFRKGIEEHCTISIIPAGHQVLHEKHVEEIVEAFQ